MESINPACSADDVQNLGVGTLAIIAKIAAEEVLAAEGSLSIRDLKRLAGVTAARILHDKGVLSQGAIEKVSVQREARKACHEILIRRGMTARSVTFFSCSKPMDDLEIGKSNWRQILSNFCLLSTPLTYWGRTYPSVEHGYQAAKFLRLATPREVALIVAGEFEAGERLGSANAVDACHAGARKGMQALGCSLDREQWEGDYMDSVMEDVLESRWAVDESFRRILREARRQGVHLVHFERSGRNSYWGGCLKE